MSDISASEGQSAGEGQSQTQIVKSSRKGRPVLGAICGFLFGLFVGLDLLFFGIVPLNSIVLTILPVVGLIVGIVLGRTRS
jgi:hypothetical protein